MGLPGRSSRDSGKDISGHRERRKKERDNTRDLGEEESCTYEAFKDSAMASHDSGFASGIGSAIGARRENVKQKKKPSVRRKLAAEKLSEDKSTHGNQNGDLSRPGTSGVGNAPEPGPVNSMRDPLEWPSGSAVSGTQEDRIVDGMRDPSTSPSNNGISTSTPRETIKDTTELSPASSVEAAIPVTTAQRPGSALGQFPAPETSGNQHPVDGNMLVQSEQSVHVSHQYSSILPVENCVFFEPMHEPEGSRSVTSVTSSQWRQQWMTIDNDHHSVVSGVSHWRQHRTTDDPNDSDNSGSKSPQSEKQSFFDRQDLSNADEELLEDEVLEDLSSNLFECSINGRSPRNTRKGSKSSEMYEMSSVKINLMSTRSYVGSPSDRAPAGHVASSPSRSQPPPSANQRPIIRQPRFSLPASPPQAVYDVGARNCRCPCCGSMWTTELELEEHYFEHLLGNRSCAVGGCEYTCSSRNELRRHIRAAHLRKHTCRRCGKAYLMASTLEHHLRQCLPSRQCPLCPSASVDDVCEHAARTHVAGQIACNRRPELRYYVCRECRFATTSRTVALDHCQHHILGEINLNITLCEICDLLFVTGDLHFLMHAVDDSLNRKSFQVVDFDWRVSLNARRQLESSLKKIKTTKAIKASIDEETSTARSNLEETTIETNDIVPPTETQLKIQEIYNEDSLQKNNNNCDLNQNEFDVTDNLNETNWSQLGESINKMTDVMQKYLAKRGTVSKNESPSTAKQEDFLEASTMKEPVQSETLVERPLEQQNTVAMSLSNDNVDNNNQTLPSSSTAEVQNQNAASHEEIPSAIKTLELNVEANDKIALPSEIHFESQVLINNNKTRVDSVEENRSLQENNKQTILVHTKVLNKRGTVSNNQSPNTAKQEDFLEARTMKERVQSETLVEGPLEQQTTAVAKNQSKPVRSETLVDRRLEQQTTVEMSQSNGNVDNNQSLPSSSTAEEQNKNVTLNENTPTAKTNFEESNVETNDIIPKSSKMPIKRQVLIGDLKARVVSMEENTTLQENKQQIFLDHTKELNKPISSKLEKNVDKPTDFMDSKLARCVTDSKNQSPSTTKQEYVLEESTMKERVQSETLVKRPLKQQTTVVALSQSNDNVDNNPQSLPSSSTAGVQKQNEALYKKTLSAIVTLEELSVETADIMTSPNGVTLKSQVILNDKEARADSVEKKTSLQENKKQTCLDHTNVSINQSPNTTQQEDVLEASTIKEPVQSITLVERPLEQQNTGAITQSNDNDNKNQSLPSSSEAEVQNQYAALDKEAITSISNCEDLSKETKDIISLSSEMQLKSQVIDINDEAGGYSEGETWLNLTISRVNQSIKLMQEINNILQQVRKTKKDPVQIEILIESPVAQDTTNNGQSSDIPFSSTVELLNQNSALDGATPTAGSNFEDSNVETTDIMSSPKEGNLESHIILNGKEVREDSVEENISLQENKKQILLDYSNEINKRGTVSKNQSPNNTQLEDVLVASTIKEPVQSVALVERPLDQPNTVAISQSNDNMDNKNQSLPSFSVAEVQNKNAALYEKTPTAITTLEELNEEANGKIALPSKTHLESQVIINDDEACVDSVEENTSLQENNKQTFLDHNNELNERDIVSKNKSPKTTKQDDVLEASTIKDSELSETSVERPLEQHTKFTMSQSNDNMENNNESHTSSLEEEVQNQNAALDGATPTAGSNFEDSNVETTDIMSSPKEGSLESHIILTGKKVREYSVEENISLQENLDATQHHQARAELTVSSGSQTEATSTNEKPSSDKNKTVASATEDTNTKDVALGKAKDLRWDHTRAKETKSPRSPTEQSNSKDISEEVQNQNINAETNSSTCTEKTDSEKNSEKGQESQHQTNIGKTKSSQKTTEEPKNHSQNHLNTLENSKQYVKNVTDDKDEPTATRSKKGQQASRGRSNNNKKRNNKNSRNGK